MDDIDIIGQRTQHQRVINSRLRSAAIGCRIWCWWDCHYIKNKSLVLMAFLFLVNNLCMDAIKRKESGKFKATEASTQERNTNDLCRGYKKADRL